jgi:hypothetical protein
VQAWAGGCVDSTYRRAGLSADDGLADQEEVTLPGLAAGPGRLGDVRPSAGGAPGRGRLAYRFTELR